jgi:hypothetical protein
MSFFKSMLQDGADGTWSSKRVVTFAAFVFCSIGFFANLFFGYEVHEYMFEGMMFIAIAGLGVTVTERFADRKPSTDKYTNHQEEL